MKYTGRVVQFATLVDGNLVELPSPVLASPSEAMRNPNDVNIWDVDAINLQDGQMFEDRKGKIWSTDTDDPLATTPNPNTGTGTIKLKSPFTPALADILGMDPVEGSANAGGVVVRNGMGQPTGKLRIETTGDLQGNAPSVEYGKGIPH